MMDPNSYGDQENMAVGDAVGEQPIGPGGYPSQYRFSPDELQVLGECNRESFVQRSMPIATLGGLGTYLAIQKGTRLNLLWASVYYFFFGFARIWWFVSDPLADRGNKCGGSYSSRWPTTGYLRPNARFGATPKVTLAVMAGYFIGKMSYQQACAEKLMALPGSYIGQLLRERRDGKVLGTSNKSRQGPTMFGAKSSDIYSDAGPGSSLDLDTDRPIFSEDAYRPTDTDGPIAPAAPEIVPTRPNLSYDDLRRKNREEHSGNKQDPYRTDSAPIVMRPQPSPAPYAARPNTNKYGDVME